MTTGLISDRVSWLEARRSEILAKDGPTNQDRAELEYIAIEVWDLTAHIPATTTKGETNVR